MIRNPRESHRSQKNSVIFPQHVKPVSGHHASVFQIILAAPVQAIIFQTIPAVDFGGRIQNLLSGRKYFLADAVSRNRRNLENFHQFFASL